MSLYSLHLKLATPVINCRGRLSYTHLKDTQENLYLEGSNWQNAYQDLQSIFYYFMELFS